MDVSTANDLVDPTSDDLFIFISHKHEDTEVAKIMLDSLVLWGIPKENLYCSSLPGQGTTAGDNISKDINSFLLRCNLLIFLYSLPEEDWSYCCYEIGAAQNDVVETRVAAISLADHDAPSFLSDKLTIHISNEKDTTQKNILSFVRSFFLEDNFFPGYSAFSPRRDENAIKYFADVLTEQICEKTQKYRTDRKREITDRWGWFTLELDNDDVETSQLLSNAMSLSESYNDLSERLHLRNHKGWGLKHFGYNNPNQAVSERKTLNEIFNHWQTSIAENHSTDHWYKELIGEIKRIYTNHNTKLTWKPLKSCYTPGFVYPVITSYESFGDGRVQYKVHMFTIPEELAQKQISE